MPRTQAQMEQDLAELLPELRGVVDTAIAEYVRKYAHVRHEHTARARAVLISDLMHIEVAKRFSATTGVRVIRKNTTIYLGLLGKYVAKFKKLSSSMQASCTGTQTSIGFAEQSVQLELSPFPESPTSLFIGYKLDEAELTKSTAWVVCPDGGREPHWSSMLPAREAVVVPLRAQPAASDQPRRRRAKPKAKPGLRAVKDGKKKKGEPDGA